MSLSTNKTNIIVAIIGVIGVIWVAVSARQGGERAAAELIISATKTAESNQIIPVLPMATAAYSPTTSIPIAQYQNEEGGSGHIYFLSERDGVSELYVMNLDGNNQMRLTNRKNVYSPSVSPDGKRIAYASLLEHDDALGTDNYELYLADIIDGSLMNTIRLTNNPFWDAYPSWSFDGKQLAFASWRYDELGEIFIIDADAINDLGAKRLTSNSSNDCCPSWLAQSDQIVYESDSNGNTEIYLLDTGTLNKHRLVDSLNADLNPSVSPDGQQIAFVSQRDGNAEIYVMDIDGSRQTNLTNNSSADYGRIAWSSDGKSIVFTSERDGNPEIYVMDSNGSNQKRLTNNLIKDYWPSWGV